MKIIYIMGKSSTGKDTIFKKLKEKINVKPYVMYTTRPKRTGEINGVDYNYLSDAEMNGYLTLQSNMLIESRTYDTVYGKWTYATILDNQFNPNKDLLMTGTLESYIHIKEFFFFFLSVELIPIYIEVEDGLRLERALKREREQKEPKYVEMCRRFIADSIDFSEDNIESIGIKKRFQNIILDDCVNEISEYVKNL